MKKFSLILASGLFLGLSACSSSAVDDFDSYEITPTGDCTYKNGKVIQEVNIKGSAKGKQSVLVKVEVEDRKEKMIARDIKGFPVNGAYDEDVEIKIKLPKEEWKSGQTKCYISSEN